MKPFLVLEDRLPQIMSLESASVGAKNNNDGNKTKPNKGVWMQR